MAVFENDPGSVADDTLYRMNVREILRRLDEHDGHINDHLTRAALKNGRTLQPIRSTRVLKFPPTPKRS